MQTFPKQRYRRRVTLEDDKSRFDEIAVDVDVLWIKLDQPDVILSAELTNYVLSFTPQTIQPCVFTLERM